MSCPDCGKRVPVLFNALEDRRCLECLKKARIKIIKEQERARAMRKLTPEQERELSEAARTTCAWEITSQTEEEE